MSYSTLPANVRSTAESVLTPRQLDVFKLWCQGYGPSRIALTLDISEPVARRHRDRAHQKIRIALAREETAA